MVAPLEYELDHADLKALFTYHAIHAPYIVARNRRMRWVWGGLFAVLALAYTAISPVGSLVFLAGGCVLLLFYGRLNAWWYVRHNLRINAGADGPRVGTTKVALENNQLLVEAPDGSSQLELSAIRRIDESESHFFIYLGPASAIIVPRRAERAEGFVAALRSALAAA